MLAKVEYLNPGGSVKDRIATRMIEAAEASGELQPGGTIVEPTSGNTGVGLAMVAQAKGYKCVFVCPDKVSEDKRNVLKAYGAEVVVCPTAVAPEHPDSYYNVSDRLVREPGAWKPDQYSNPNNPRSHYETTGPEIWEQTEGKITHFVAGVGTGGTISGIGRYLKEQNPDVQVVGADPAGSVYSGGTGRPYLVEGVGEDFWPDDLRPRHRRPHHRGLRRRLVRVHPAAGPRGGAAGRRLVRAWRRTPPCSSPQELAGTPEGDGRRDRGPAARLRPRLPHQGLQRRVAGPVRLPDRQRGPTSRTVGEVLRGKSGRLPDLVHTHPGETIAEAVHILQEYGVSQMPVVRAEPPIVAAEVAGSVSERTLLDALFAGHAKLTDQVEDHMSAAAADDRLDRGGPRRRRRCSRTPTRCWCRRTASRSACSPARTCSPTWPAAERCGRPALDRPPAAGARRAGSGLRRRGRRRWRADPAARAAARPARRSPVQMLATNKLASICGTSVSSVTYYRRVKPHPRTFIPLMIFAFAGSAGGALPRLAHPEGPSSRSCWSLLVPVGGLRPAQARRWASPPRCGSAATGTLRRRWLTGLVVGFYDGALGPGTGSLLRVRPGRAARLRVPGGLAKARMANWATNLAALCVFVPQGAVLWEVGLLMGACNLVGGYLGARVAVARGARFVRVFFIVVSSAFVVRIGGEVFGLWS